MSKSKHSKQGEFLLEQIRNLKAQNRNLKKRLRQLEKNKYMYHELKLDKEADEEIDAQNNPMEPMLTTCPSCFKGKLEEKEVIGRYWSECNLCNFRTKTTKI